jgi:hypothetical protein
VSTCVVYAAIYFSEFGDSVIHPGLYYVELADIHDDCDEPIFHVGEVQIFDIYSGFGEVLFQVSHMDTVAPRASRYFVSARPRPRLAPVTAMTFPAKGWVLTVYSY